jgi:hypothetical protein
VNGCTGINKPASYFSEHERRDFPGDLFFNARLAVLGERTRVSGHRMSKRESATGLESLSRQAG